MPNLFLNNTTTTVKGKGPVGIIKDNLVLNHNYNAGSVIPCSDGAAYFDGAGDDGVTTSLVPNYTNITMSAWIWPVADSDTKAIATARDSAADGFLWYVTGSENLNIKMNGLLPIQVLFKQTHGNTLLLLGMVLLLQVI